MVMTQFATPQQPQTGAALYLDLIKRVLTRHAFPELVELHATGPKRRVLDPLQAALRRRGYLLVTSAADRNRAIWSNRATQAETMIGLERLDNIQFCVEEVVATQVPGDLIEAGAWRGGASIFMRAVLAAHGITDRYVWVADSFKGFPAVTRRSDSADKVTDYTGGLGDVLFNVDVETVRQNFDRYGLLDDRVQFVAGWFNETLPQVPAARFAVVRIDCDLYESTLDALQATYPRLSPGGFVIIDDYGTYEGCRRAVDLYRSQMAIDDEIVHIDHHAVYWQRSSGDK